MLNRILYSVLYRFRKVNTKLIKGSDNSIKNKGKMVGCCIEIFGDNNSIEIGENSIIRNVNFNIKGNNCRIIIGENNSIKSGELVAQDNKTLIQIGNKTTIENAHIAVTEDDSKIEIGEDCMLANHIEIRSGDSHSILDAEGKRINYAESIKIHDHVWIGNRSMILKGVEIGLGSVIAAGSIVTKSIEGNTIAGGNTAKVIKQNITWKRERISK